MYIKEICTLFPKLQGYLQRVLADFPSDAQVSVIKLRPNEVVLQEGDPAEYIYVLVEGETVLTRADFHPYTYIMEYVRAIMFFGEFEALAKCDNYIATIRALADCTVIRFNYATYFLWLKRNPENAFNRASAVIEILVDQLNGERTKIFQDSAGRLRLFLLDYYARHAFSGMQLLQIAATREEISSAIGLNVRTVNRQIRKLCDVGLLTSSKRKLYISPKQYQEMAHHPE